MFTKLVLADFYERTRRYSFLITLGFVLFFAYLVITGKYTLSLGECRGIYNGAWTGSLMAIGSTSILMFAGFFLVNNSIQRDRITGVGEILSTTSLGKIPYLFAKFISNFLVQLTMLLILIVAALFMQILLGDTKHFDLWTFFSPFLLLSLPMIVFTSSLAVLFESIRQLSSTFGNILFFILMQFILVISLESHNPNLDILGAGTLIPDMEFYAQKAYPDARISVTLGFVTGLDKETAPHLLFEWPGYKWSTTLILSKCVFLAFSIILVLLSSWFFRGFENRQVKKIQKKQKYVSDKMEQIENMPTSPTEGKLLQPIFPEFNFFALLKAEMLVMFKGKHPFWFLIALAFILLPIIVPASIAFEYLLPGAWIWPLTLWSAMGTREYRYRTHEFVYSAPFPLTRQIPATWLAGVLLTLATGSGVMLKSLFIGDITLFLCLTVATIFIPSLAFSLGKASGSKKLFEVVFMLLWYIGPVNGLPILNFMGTDPLVRHSMIPLFYLLISCFLLCTLPIMSRRKQFT